MEQLEKTMLKQNEKTNKHEEEIEVIFKALKQLLEETNPPRKRIGFKAD